MVNDNSLSDSVLIQIGVLEKDIKGLKDTLYSLEHSSESGRGYDRQVANIKNQIQQKTKQIQQFKRSINMNDSMEQLKLMGFTIDAKDDDATEHGSIETYGKEKETETMPLEKDPVQAQDAHQNGEHVKVKNHGTGELVDLKVLKDNGDGTLEVKAPTGAVITIKESWIYKGQDRTTQDEEPTNAVKDSYDMLKLCGIVTNDTKPLVGEVVEVDSPRVGQFTGRCVSVSSRWADIKILHMKNSKEPGIREGDIVSVNFEYIKV